MTTTVTLRGRIAHLALADDDDETADDGYLVHGVALGDDDVTRGQNGLKRWPASELETAAATLSGTPVLDGHGGDQIGTVRRSAYEPGVGVVYEASVEDEDIASALSLGQREISIEAGNPSTVDRDGETGAAILRNFEFTGIAVVERGAAPSNYTAAGDASGNPAVAALSASAIESTLDGDSPVIGTVVGVEQSDDGDTLVRLSPGATAVSPEDGEGTEGEPEPDTSPDGQSSGEGADSAEESADTDGGGDGADDAADADEADADDTAETGDADADEDSTETVDSEAGDGSTDDVEDADAAADAESDSPSTEDSDTADASTRNEPADTDSMSEANESTQNETEESDPDPMAALAEARERVNELESEVSDKEEQIAGLEETVESYEDEIETVRLAYASVLFDEDGVITPEEAADKWSVGELRQKHEEQTEADLSADLDSEGADPDVQSGDDLDSEEDREAELSEEDREEVEKLETQIAALEKRDGSAWDAALEQKQARLAELRGDD